MPTAAAAITIMLRRVFPCALAAAALAVGLALLASSAHAFLAPSTALPLRRPVSSSSSRAVGGTVRAWRRGSGDVQVGLWSWVDGLVRDRYIRGHTIAGRDDRAAIVRTKQMMAAAKPTGGRSLYIQNGDDTCVVRWCCVGCCSID